MGFDRISKWQGSREDCREHRDFAAERFGDRVAKNRGANFHWADLIDHHQALLSDRLTNSGDADSFQRRKIESVFSQAIGCFEIDMGEYSLLAINRYDLESGARATVANFLGVKTTSGSRQIICNPPDQCRLATAGATGEQNFFSHSGINIGQL